MRVHVIQHVPFEGPAAIADWARDRGHQVTSSLALTQDHPPVEQIDFLVVMGGPMAADDAVTSPWLHAEKHLIAAVIAAGRPVLGVCLGAQIIAEVIGGVVRRNEHREIGWFAVERTSTGDEEQLFSAWESPVMVGQWHGDTFDLPLGIEPVLSSEACRNQAFVFDGRVVGLQFHLEWTDDSLHDLMEHCSAELVDDGPYVMTAEQLAAGAKRALPDCRARLFELLDGMLAVSGAASKDERR